MFDVKNLLNDVKAKGLKLIGMAQEEVEETADGIMATFIDAVDGLDVVAEKAIEKSDALVKEISELDILRCKAVEETEKAVKYAKNLRKVLEV